MDAYGHGTITQSVFMGASIHYWIAAAGKTLRAVTTGGSAPILSNGQRVRLVPPPSLHLLRAHKAGGRP